ncbi:MAG: hypothetical protein SOV46_02670 [Candidatus Faecousia sp.]|nr:hypothetical protein [Candidatus Faecousia sp.]
MKKGLISKAKLTAIADAIRNKTGETDSYTLAQMVEKIAGLSPAELPELTKPAAEKDVLAGKEYIDGSGAKKAGTLMVCDTVQDAEYFGIAGTGLYLDLESTADWSGKTMTLAEKNLLPENIKSGVSIFGIAGSVKEIRTETGTITPAEDTKSITIPCTDGAKAFILEATDDTISAIEGQSLTYAAAFAGSFLSKHNIESAANTVITAWYNNKYANGGIKAQNSGGVTLSSSFKFYPGTYRWTAYYWEDDA